MSQWDIKGLETNFEGFRKDRYPSLPISEAFERFGVRQILKDADLSDDEVEGGVFAGQDDGGVDGMYFFVSACLPPQGELLKRQRRSIFQSSSRQTMARQCALLNSVVSQNCYEMSMETFAGVCSNQTFEIIRE